MSKPLADYFSYLASWHYVNTFLSHLKILKLDIVSASKIFNHTCVAKVWKKYVAFLQHPIKLMDIITLFWHKNSVSILGVMTHWGECQRYTYKVFQTIQMKLRIHLCVWAEQAVSVSAKTALKLKCEILIRYNNDKKWYRFDFIKHFLSVELLSTKIIQWISIKNFEVW